MPSSVANFPTERAGGNFRSHRIDRVRRGDVRNRCCQQLQRFPGRHGHRRTRLRHIVAVDLALVVDVLPDKGNAAKDLGVFIMAGALPFSVGPAILAMGGQLRRAVRGSRGLRHHRSRRILPVKRVR